MLFGLIKMVYHLKDELAKFAFDIPVYGAILFTKVQGIDTSGFTAFTQFLYDYGWLILLIIRVGNALAETHNKLKKKEKYIKPDGSVGYTSTYQRISEELNKWL